MVGLCGTAPARLLTARPALPRSVTLKTKMSDGKEKNSRNLKENVMKMIYCEMLGQNADFGHMEAVRLVNRPDQKSILLKRIGYLAASLVLDEDNQLVILLVNTMHKDLGSNNVLEVCASLQTACKLINPDTIPAVLEDIVKLLEHKEPIVRKKAVMALHSLYQKSKQQIVHLTDKIRNALVDRDPSVMGAALCFLETLIAEDPASSQSCALVSPLVQILKKTIEGRLGSEYYYHRIPAPWIQIKVLKMLSILGTSNQSTSEMMYEVLFEVMRRADNLGVTIGHAIVYESVQCAIKIYPNAQLLETAAQQIGKFLRGEQQNQNLKYLGITSLAAIVQVNPKFALEHQMTVVKCLEEEDDTIQTQTLDLLIKMANPKNIMVICEKLLKFLEDDGDLDRKQVFTSRIAGLAERYAPDSYWFIDTMNQIFSIGGNLVKADSAFNLMRLIAEGQGRGPGTCMHSAGSRDP